MIKVLVQYLLLPLPFALTFVLPIAFFFINRKYVWFSILLTVFIELAVNWGNFIYYESCTLMIYATLLQIVVMASIIWILKAISFIRK